MTTKKTYQQILVIDTAKPDLRSESLGWSCEDGSLVELAEPIGNTPCWASLSDEGPTGPHPKCPLVALRHRWTLLAPPAEKTYTQHGEEYVTWEWWFVRDVER